MKTEKLMRGVAWAIVLCVMIVCGNAQESPTGVPVRFTGGAVATGADFGQMELEFQALPSADHPTGLFQLQGGSYSGVFAITPPGSSTSNPLREKHVARLEPGKIYSITVNGELIQLDRVGVTIHPPAGYEVEINGERKTQYLTSSSKPFNPATGLILNVRVFNPSHGMTGRAGTASSLASGRLFWEVALGGLPNGNSAGSLSLIDSGESSTWASLFTRAGLQYWEPSTDVRVHRVSGDITQVIAPEACVDVVKITDTSCELRFFPFARMNAGTTFPRSFSGFPYVTYLIERNGSDTSLQITRETRDLSATTAGDAPATSSVIGVANAKAAIARTDVTTITRTGTWPNVSWDRKDWATKATSQVFLAEEVRTPPVGGNVPGERKETIKVRAPGAPSTTNPTSISVKTLGTFNWGEEVTSMVRGSGTTTNAETTYQYYQDANVLGSYSAIRDSKTRGDEWEAFEYDASNFGVIVRRHRPFQGAPTSAPTNLPSSTAGEITSYSYEADAYGRPSRPILIETRVGNNLTAKTTVAYSNLAAVNGMAVVQAIRDEQVNSTGSVLRTTTKYYREDVADAFFQSQIHSIQYPDGRKVSFAYQRGTLTGSSFTASATGTASRIVSITGSATSGIPYGTFDGYDIDDLYLVASVASSVPISKSTMQVTLRDQYARVVRTETRVWNAAGSPQDWVVVASTDYAYDLANHVSGWTASNGSEYGATYSGEQLTSETDASGVARGFTYDIAGRLETATEAAAGSIAALTTKFIYDEEHRMVKRIVGWTGSSTAETLDHAWAFDDAGRLASESVPGGNVTGIDANIPITTTYTYAPTSRQVTVDLPGGGQRIDVYDHDGTLKETTGSGVIYQYYSRSVTATTGVRYAKVSVATSTSDRFVESWFDWLGRRTTMSHPGFYGTGAVGVAQPASVESMLFDNGTSTVPGSGRLTKTTRTGYANTLYGYDELARINRVGLDVQTTPTDTLTLASSDRISDSNVYFENIGTTWWLTTVTRTYPKDGVATALTTSTTRERMAGGFSGNLRAETQFTDVDGNLTVRSVSVDRSTATTTVSTTTAGHAQTQSETFVNGLPTEVTRFDGLTYSVGYDGLHRPQTSVDPRTGTTTTSYKRGSTSIWQVKDPRAVSAPSTPAVATYGYDSAGRVSFVQDAGGNVVYTAYNKRHQVIRRWGSGTHPVEFTYNAFGEQVAMRTFRVSTVDFTSSTWPVTDDGLDTEGNPTPASWTTGDITTWAYDGPSGLLKTKTDASSKSVEFTYNVRGQPRTRQWARTLTGTTHVTTTYSYWGDTSGDAQTGELKGISYNDTTPAVGFAYTRMGQVDSVTDASGARDFIYDPGNPHRLATEALDLTFYAGRMISRLYDPASPGTFDTYTTGVVAGRPAGFQLGVPTNSARDLQQSLVRANSGRFVGVKTQASGGTNRDFVYDYTANSSLVSGYHTGTSFTVSRDFETKRDLATRVEAKWGSTSITRFDLGYNDLGQRISEKQSGTAFADYVGASTSAVYNYYAYNSRGELKTAMMGRGTPSTTGNSPASADQLPGRRFEYRYDHLGNRTEAGPVDPDVSGNAPLAAVLNNHYTTNSRNLYDLQETRTVRVLGSASAAAAVTADSGALIGKLDRNFAGDVVPPNSSGPARGNVTVGAAALGAGSGGGDLVKTIARSYVVPQRQVTPTYDDNGNLTMDGLWTYAYDGENRLIRMTSTLPASAGFTRLKLEFKYDYVGRRIEKQVFNLDSPTGTPPSFDHRYVYEGWDLIAETTAAGSLTRSYTWGLDVLGSRGATGGIGALLQVTNHNANGTLTSYFPSIDARGNIAALTREDGVLAAIYEYSPFGELLRAEKLDPAVSDQPFRFASKFWDEETGLSYYGHRYFSAVLGRFINRDPIGESGGLNLQGFCGNDSINGWDYLGLAEGDVQRAVPGQHLPPVQKHDPMVAQVLFPDFNRKPMTVAPRETDAARKTVILIIGQDYPSVRPDTPQIRAAPDRVGAPIPVTPKNLGVVVLDAMGKLVVGAATIGNYADPPRGNLQEIGTGFGIARSAVGDAIGVDINNPRFGVASDIVLLIAPIALKGTSNRSVVIDVGGEGRYPEAINLNPGTRTTTTGVPGRPIPNLVVGVGEQMPFAARSADVLIVENAPMRTGTAAELARVIKPDGTIRLVHPSDYATTAHRAVIEAVGPDAIVKQFTENGITTTTIILPPWR